MTAPKVTRAIHARTLAAALAAHRDDDWRDVAARVRRDLGLPTLPARDAQPAAAGASEQMRIEAA